MPYDKRRQKLIIELVDEKQKNLTELFILPHINSLFLAATTLRDSIDHMKFVTKPNVINKMMAYFLSDEHLQSLVEKHIKKASQKYLNKYPIGCCCEITVVIVKYLIDMDKKDRDRFFPGLSDFLYQGGVFKRIWGEVRQKYFQNAIQIGAIYLDVSNDTVDIKKTKTEWALLSECNFSCFDSFHSYARILESYHEKELFLNGCLPELAPLCPIWTRQKNGSFRLDCSLFMMGLAHDTNYHASEELFEIRSPCIYDLPVELLSSIKSITQKFKGNSEALKYLSFNPVSEDERRNIFKYYRCLKSEEKNTYIDRAQNYAKLINYQLTSETR